MLIVRLLLGLSPGPSRTTTLLKFGDARTAAKSSSEINTPRVSAAESARIRMPAGSKPMMPTTTKAKIPMAMVTSTKLKACDRRRVANVGFVVIAAKVRHRPQSPVP
jgi:hypothetical protein